MLEDPPERTKKRPHHIINAGGIPPKESVGGWASSIASGTVEAVASLSGTASISAGGTIAGGTVAVGTTFDLPFKVIGSGEAQPLPAQVWKWARTPKRDLTGGEWAWATILAFEVLPRLMGEAGDGKEGALVVVVAFALIVGWLKRTDGPDSFFFKR